MNKKVVIAIVVVVVLVLVVWAFSAMPGLWQMVLRAHGMR